MQTRVTQIVCYNDIMFLVWYVNIYSIFLIIIIGNAANIEGSGGPFGVNETKDKHRLGNYEEKSGDGTHKYLVYTKPWFGSRV